MTPSDAELVARLGRAAEYIKCLPLFDEAAARIEALAAEVERLRKDAERYQVARNHARLGPHGEWVLILGDPHSVSEPKAHFDADIDAALAAAEPAVREIRRTEYTPGGHPVSVVDVVPSTQAERYAAPGPAVPLTFDAFRAANVTRCVKWHPKGIESWSPSDWLVAVTGEPGELASLLKMRNRERDGLPGNKFSPTDKQVADELADVLTYLDLLAAVLGVNLGVAVVEKFNEVSARVGFPDRIDAALAVKETK